MKRSIKKIGNETVKMGEAKVTRSSVRILLPVLLILSLSACEKAWHGSDGRPGDAFIALTWQVEEPNYIDAGTGAIPPRFYYGQYYKINPGFYELYYEGSIWTGQFWGFYAWEVTYEIWEVPGERGDWYYNGANGPDNYFDIEMSPYGPYVYSSYKSGEMDSKYEIIEKSDDLVVIVQKGEGINMKATFKKVEPRYELDKGELTR
jgi:hypothetical protein